MAVRVVTDSTSDLPRDLAQGLDITVVPLNVHFGAQVYRDGVDMLPDEFYRRLMQSAEPPKTSAPSIGEFMEVYERLSKDAEGILSVHISSRVSGTMNAAGRAREQVSVGCPIEVLDTYQASMGVGLVALVAARLAKQGASFQEVVSAARQAASRCRCFALLDTLEYLQKGGRIGKAQAMVGSLLKVKPMVIVRDGEVHPLDRPRTRPKGLARLKEVARSFAPVEEMAVLYSTTPEDARQVARDLADLLPQGKTPYLARFGPVLGTYVGPGALGIGLLRAVD